MFRKSEKLNVPLICSPQPWFEVQKCFQPKSDETGDFVEHVYMDLVPCDKLSEQVLRPVDVNMRLVIETGNVIDPSNALNVLQNTDVSVLEENRERFASDMYEFIMEHKDNFKK